MPNHYRLPKRRLLATIGRASAALLVVSSILTSPVACYAAGGGAANADASVRMEPAVKDTIKGALKFLASQQRLNGSWSGGEGKGGHPVAITSYVLLAYMATGNLPGTGDYSKNVTAGMQYLLDRIQPDGQFMEVQAGQYMYNHGMATIALAEMYGQSLSPAIRPKLEKLVQVILKAQAPDGGWRYTPQPKDSDVSVTVMQAVALRAAQESGLSVPQSAIDNAIKYVGACSHPSGGFTYQAGSGQPGFARTAAAVYSLQVLGKYDDPKIKAGSAYLFANAKKRDGHWAYGNYYAAPAQYMIGGETWRNWYEQVKGVLMSEVKREGDQAHWEPRSKEDVSPSFCTAVYVHILAMPYHYLPLYQR